MYRFCVLRLFCFSRFLLSSFCLLFSFSLAHLAPCLLHLGPSWLHLGLLLAPSWAILASSWAILAPSWLPRMCFWSLTITLSRSFWRCSPFCACFDWQTFWCFYVRVPNTIVMHLIVPKRNLIFPDEYVHLSATSLIATLVFTTTQQRTRVVAGTEYLECHAPASFVAQVCAFFVPCIFKKLHVTIEYKRLRDLLVARIHIHIYI